jgi:hypothetical protein
VALHEVAAEPVRDADGALEVDRAAGRDAAQRGAAQRLGHDVGGEGAVPAVTTVRQTPLTAIDSPWRASLVTSGRGR